MCLAILEKASDARSAIINAKRLVSKPFGEMTDEEALRYQLIVLVEALASMCMKFARLAYGRFYSSYRQCLVEMDKEMGTNCGAVLSSLISLRNLLVHRYFQVDDQKLYNSVRGNFTCVEN
ncbi:DUF86 domain-containing protein [Pyrobaculum aerophilum]|uniref:DUF86 domain-containing protein n=1 Tax=Pyrobaculum aerophilum TaxID=13773 RepID=UPI0023F3AE89|nr:DUF86 domain-containing protein [Pyrobaculum aerophilum]MCX8135581.1 DUF86 domain-containing protein [Pyrobaculum aerophilum]